MKIIKFVLPAFLALGLAACGDGHKHEQQETKQEAEQATQKAEKNSAPDDHKHDDEKHDAHEHERKDHAAHEHGAARLTIATTETGLDMTLETPAANVFGFEHQAKTDEDKQTMRAASERLLNTLLPNSEARCELKSRSVETGTESEGHSDVDASWTFSCANMDKLDSVDVQLFSTFPQGFQHVNAEWITATGAGAKELEQDTMLELR